MDDAKKDSIDKYRQFQIIAMARNTPYSKMAENALFFSLHVNWPLLPRFNQMFLWILQMGSRQQGPINNETKE